MTIAAYKRTISETEAPRQIERRLLAQVTAELERAHMVFDALEDGAAKLEQLSSGLHDVLWRNQQIWQAFKMDLLDNNNGLNPELRAGILSLAIWVDRHTHSVMAGKAKIKPLIDINRSIFLGLGGKTTPAEV